MKKPGAREGVTVGLGSTLSVAVGVVHEINVCVSPAGILPLIGPCGQPVNTGAKVSTAMQKRIINVNNKYRKKKYRKGAEVFNLFISTLWTIQYISR